MWFDPVGRSTPTHRPGSCTPSRSGYSDSGRTELRTRSGFGGRNYERVWEGSSRPDRESHHPPHVPGGKGGHGDGTRPGKISGDGSTAGPVSRDWVASPRRTADSFGRPAFTTESGRPDSDHTQQVAATPSPRTSHCVIHLQTDTGKNNPLSLCCAQAASGPAETLCRTYAAAARRKTYDNRTKPARWKAACCHARGALIREIEDGRRDAASSWVKQTAYSKLAWAEPFAE